MAKVLPIKVGEKILSLYNFIDIPIDQAGQDYNLLKGRIELALQVLLMQRKLGEIIPGKYDGPFFITAHHQIAAEDVPLKFAQLALCNYQERKKQLKERIRFHSGNSPNHLVDELINEFKDIEMREDFFYKNKTKIRFGSVIDLEAENCLECEIFLAEAHSGWRNPHSCYGCSGIVNRTFFERGCSFQEKSLIKIYCHIKNKTEQEAIKNLAKKLEISGNLYSASVSSSKQCYLKNTNIENCFCNFHYKYNKYIKFSSRNGRYSLGDVMVTVENGQKQLIPSTCCGFKNFRDGFSLNVPFAGSYPLLHLDILAREQDAEIILTDSLELAVVMETKSYNSPPIYTSWYGGAQTVDFVKIGRAHV